MDVNGTPYFLLREPAEFAHGSSAFGWDPRRGAFTLRQCQQLRLAQVPVALARAAWADAGALVRDPFGQVARIAPGSGPGTDGGADTGTGLQRDHVVVAAGLGFAPLRDDALRPVAAPAPAADAPVPRLVDLALGGTPDDARLVVGYSDGAARHGLILFHLGRRWQQTLASELPAAPVRACVDADGAVWCLTASALVYCTGGPLPLPYAPQPLRFEPETITPHPFAAQWTQSLPPDLRPLALCTDADSLYLLAEDWPGWQADALAGDGAGLGTQRVLTRPRDPDPLAPWTDWPVVAPGLPAGTALPYAVDLGLFADGRLAVPAPREPGDVRFVQRDCPVLELHRHPTTGARTARLVYQRYPRHEIASPRLVGNVDGAIYYQAAPDGGDAGPRVLRLSALARPVFPTAARVRLRLGPSGVGLDAGRPDTPWHRVYIDGCIPPGCRLRFFAKAFNDPASRTAVPYAEQPAPLWNPLGSELPFHAPLAPNKPGESGLFEVLLQHRDGAVRTLTGRYLQLRILMEGDGQHTPAIHALRIYAPRFSYQEAWLPPLFRQQAARADADTDNATGADSGAATGPANGADVRERLLAACEGLLTPIEGRIAAAEALLDPHAAPPALLPVLAATLGIRLPPEWPEARARRLLASGCLVQQWRGTWPGLRLALDIASDGGVARGEVVIVEHFRLRRTFATILGLDLDDRDHPLTLGTGESGNSIVGDSLILADGASREFLALLAPALAPQLAAAAATNPACAPADGPSGSLAGRPAGALAGGLAGVPLGSVAADAGIVADFFDRYSNRVSVLLHGPARARRGAVEAVLGTDLPAHLCARIIETDRPFVLGLAPLLEIDSFLTNTPPPRRATLDDTWLGHEGVLTNPVALSPRDLNARGGAA
jgi:phage tail-like protein